MLSNVGWYASAASTHPAELRLTEVAAESTHAVLDDSAPSSALPGSAVHWGESRRRLLPAQRSVARRTQSEHAGREADA